MTTDDKIEYLYNTGQQTQRDVLQNSIRLYGVKKNDARGANPTEILKRICDEGLKLARPDVDHIVGSALRFIQRVESGKCIVFQLNRVDLIRKIFGNLRDYENPYNKQAKIVFTRNLCPEDNRIRSECLSIKELLREKGFRDIKIRFNKLISVNGGIWHDYTWFLEHRFTEADNREKHAAAAHSQGTSGSGPSRDRQQESYANVAKKRKGDQDRETQDGGDGDISSNASPTGSETQDQASGSGAKGKKQRKVNKKSKH